MNTIDNVRKVAPLIHHITNQVVMNFTANGLLAFGGSPIMAKERAEATDMATIANGLLINIGTMLKSDIEAMVLAGTKANERGIPVVLDPVGVAASRFRKEQVQRLLQEISFTAIKGNAGEMAHLAGVSWETKGVESTDGDVAQLEQIATQIARKFKTIAIITGETDIVTDGKTTHRNNTGHKLLTKITGAGCLLGSIVTACLAANDDLLTACYDAVTFYGEAAEYAVQSGHVNGTGTFIPHFIDALQR